MEAGEWRRFPKTRPPRHLHRALRHRRARRMHRLLCLALLDHEFVLCPAWCHRDILRHLLLDHHHRGRLRGRARFPHVRRPALEADHDLPVFVPARRDLRWLRGDQHDGDHLPGHADAALQDHHDHLGALHRDVRAPAHRRHAVGPTRRVGAELPLPRAPSEAADPDEALALHARDDRDSGPRAVRLPLHRDVLHPLGRVEPQQDLLCLRLHARDIAAFVPRDRVRQHYLHVRAPQC
mmetsp:Transcript_2479/g.7477  ORF Transcript_2479/g.7477 Transcript_2479/m.7477 type:complete len:237 (-) Transcript_2479:376-1086(-)